MSSIKTLFGIFLFTCLITLSNVSAEPQNKPEMCSYCSPSCVCGAPPITQCEYNCPKDTHLVHAHCKKKCQSKCDICNDSRESCPSECTVICETSPWRISEDPWNLTEWKEARCPPIPGFPQSSNKE